MNCWDIMNIVNMTENVNMYKEELIIVRLKKYNLINSI